MTRSPKKSSKLSPTKKSSPKKSRNRAVHEKFCSCLVKVGAKTNGNKFAICTKSVYGSRRLKGPGRTECFGETDFSKYSLVELKAYAKEFGVYHSKLRKSELLEHLEYLQSIKKQVNHISLKFAVSRLG